MKHDYTLHFVCSMALLLSACSTVPQVESRLQAMQLHSNMYVVQAGESLESIAYRYRLSTDDLKTLNPGIEGSVRAGLRINVRPGTVLASSVRSRESYAPVPQPALVSEEYARAQRSNNSRGTKNPGRAIAPQAPVIISPASNQVQIAAEKWPTTREPIEPKEEIIEQFVAVTPEFTEIPANARVNPAINPIEVPLDVVEYEPVSSLSNSDSQFGSGTASWVWPTVGPVARGFAPNEVGGQGVDIAGTPGQDVRAAQAGTILYSGRDLSGGGNLIIVRHDNDLMTTYSHTDNLYVAEDDIVLAGDPIASLGWNEKKESVLSFEVRQGGNPLDPMNFLPKQ